MNERRDSNQHFRISDVSPMEFGRFVGIVEVLAVEVASLRLQVKSLQDQMTGGKGVVFGVMLASGGIGAGAAHLLDKFFK